MNKNIFITILISLITVFIITIGSTYAYFTSTIIGEEQSTTVSVGGNHYIVSELYALCPSVSLISTAEVTWIVTSSNPYKVVWIMLVY